MSSEDTVALLRDLIRNRCVNDGTPDSGQEVRNASRIAEHLDGVEVDLVEPHPGRVSAIFRVRGTDPEAPALSLIGHTDVVDVRGQDWSFDPFAAEVVDDPVRGPVVQGRGALDMLALTTAMAEVTRRIATAPGQLRGDLVFAAVADEEHGGRLGTGWITENRPDLLPVSHALTEAGGTQDGDGVVITVGERGGAARRLVVRGPGGHGSTPYGRRNPALLLAEATARIGRYRPRPRVDDHWRGLVERWGLPAADVTALTGDDPDAFDAALDAFGTSANVAHAITHDTFTPTVLRAGSKINVVPALAELDLDVRILPGTTDDDVDAHLRTALGDLAAEVEIVRLSSGAPGSVSPVTTDLFAAIDTAVRRHAGAPALPILTAGGTDARFVRRRGGVAYGFGLFSPTWTLGEHRSLLHAADERVDVETLRLTTEALHDTVTAFLGAPVGAGA